MKLIAIILIFCTLNTSAQAHSESKPNMNIPLSSTPNLAAISPVKSYPASISTAEHFSGKVHIQLLFNTPTPARVTGAQVTFEPSARTAWHTHPLGQTLIVTAGKGHLQFWGSPTQSITTGDVVWIPPAQKHWHGATPTSSMTHIAIQERQDGQTAEWFELVSQAQYASAVATPPPAAQPTQPSHAQQLMGDIAPKLAELTDGVLLGDIWERPNLTKRDRSLVTVSALIATNHPDQLRSHLALARQNGVTQEELVEAITQLAFYTGWPNAVSAIGIAREVFAKP